jgi:molybdopterin-guanine dinucleotide biosynthesis protein A
MSSGGAAAMKAKFNCGICVLAGGLSTRMGRNKGRLRLGQRTMLGQIRVVANTLGLPVRVIRRDLLPRCGSIGGIYTAQKTSRFEAELFLACDMPFVSAEWLAALLAVFHRKPRPLFTAIDRVAGFPLLLPRAVLPVVEAQILQRKFSLQELARALRARLIRPPRARRAECFNVNSPADWQTARRTWNARQKRRAAQGQNPSKSGL